MSENTEDFARNDLVVIRSEYESTPIGLKKNASNTITDKDNAPRILCNELIVNPNKNKSLEKLDELSSLEREIAKMHHADEGNMELESSSIVCTETKEELKLDTNKSTSSTATGDTSNEEKSVNITECAVDNVDDKLDTITSGESALEHEDLIAVLKGLDGNTDEAHNSSGSVLEGVTIEGEGEYQIMEVVDDDSNATDDNTKAVVDLVSTVDTTSQNLNKTKIFGSTSLTVQEERALALEQMEGLKTAPRRRKQDVKPIRQIDPALDLVTALEADWSEHEEDMNEKPKSEIKTKSTNKNKIVASTISEIKTNLPLITSVVVIPSSTATVSSTTVPITNCPTITNVNIGGNDTNDSESLKDSNLSPTEEVIEKKSEETAHVPGFRRTRIIKRKIIWDPDAPETTFSYANLVKSNSTSKTKTEAIVKPSIRKGSTTITPIKKEVLSSDNFHTTKKNQRPITPKAKKPSSDINMEKAVLVKSEKSTILKNIEQEDKNTLNKTEELHATTEQNLDNKSSSANTTPPKRRSQTPISNGPNCGASVKKKKITELDRLMGDEGAVNMLNSLEKLESDAKSNRPMMRSRAATICEKLPRKDTSPNPSTSMTPSATTNSQANKCKRTPKSRASSSWDYVYKKKKQDFEDSLIIRRRSNSSYSSTTSQNRSSLDGPPASIVNNNGSNSSTNCNDSLPTPKNENDLSKRSPTSVHSKSSGSLKSRSTPILPTGKSFEFAKPESRKSLKHSKIPAATLTNDMKKSLPVANKRNARSPANTNEDKSKDVAKTPSTKSPTNTKKDTTSSYTTISDVVVKKSSKVAQILFSTSKAKLSNTFTIQMLNKLADILDKLSSDPDCHVVVIGTNDAHFCQGIDITDLTTIADDKRKNYAVNLATSAKNYLKTLATFPKPIIGGVHGNLLNLGVIQLALFDIVIASDKTTFETKYPKMGQTPEGYCIWHNMNKIRGSFKTKLFWLCEKVQSTEAALAGLVNKLTVANKVNDDALITAKRIAALSTESYRVMKKTAVNGHLDVIANSLDDEFNTIIKQWTSIECLENLKKYIGQDVPS